MFDAPRQALHFGENLTAWRTARTKDVTSTDCAALFNLSPYETAFGLWNAKKDGIVGDGLAENDRMKWGRRLQGQIAAGIADDEGLKIRALNTYIRVPDWRLGSSFDYEIVSHANGPGLLEVKKVDELIFRDQWADGEEAPLHIEFQLQHELLACDRKWGAIGVLIGGNRSKVLYRNRDDQVCAKIRDKVVAFWKSIEQNNPPTPDLLEDAALIAKIYGFADPAKIMDCRQDPTFAALCADYTQAMRAEKDAEESKTRAKSALLTHLGDHERAWSDAFTVSAGMVEATEPTVITADMVGQSYGGRKGYRGIRVTTKKEKAK